ncbi:hypothetical protein BGZ90_002001 [Linnemannia elongata]|nr:hypothetical protein BGZ90_002001 [Linnemannia elongata]
MMLPQKFVSLVGPIENEYGKLASTLMHRDDNNANTIYKAGIRQTMMTKRGVLRGEMMGGHVDGSGRMVIIPCWDIEKNEIAIPRRVASKMKFPVINKIPYDGAPGGGALLGAPIPSDVCSSRSIQEGDYMLVVRPPSLWHGNTQPMRVKLWDRESIGFSPANCEEYHADFDGDEVQIYPLGSDEAIAEAMAWVDAAGSHKPLDDIAHLIPDYDERNDNIKNFMKHTTLSIRELAEGIEINRAGARARMKESTAMLSVNMMNTDMDAELFYQESLRGINDVMAQQLTQGAIGEMSRHARLAAACFQGPSNGKLTVFTNDGIAEIASIAHAASAAGVPSIAGINRITSVAQQAALDSHRAGIESITRFDMVRNIVEGSDDIVVILSTLHGTWSYWSIEHNGNYLALVKSAHNIAFGNVIGCYHPSVLAMMKDRSMEVCYIGLVFACSYIGVNLSAEQMIATTASLCYEPEKHDRPVFTRIGMSNRNLRWFCQLVNSHYGKISEMIASGVTKRMFGIDTIAECLAFYNFDNMH